MNTHAWNNTFEYPRVFEVSHNTIEYLANKIAEYYGILLNTFTKFGNKTMNTHEYS